MAENIDSPDLKTFVFDQDSRLALLNLEATRPQAIPKGMAPLVKAAKDRKLAVDLTPSIRESVIQLTIELGHIPPGLKPLVVHCTEREKTTNVRLPPHMVDRSLPPPHVKKEPNSPPRRRGREPYSTESLPGEKMMALGAKV